jgi:hypothetical protein
VERETAHSKERPNRDVVQVGRDGCPRAKRRKDRALIQISRPGASEMFGRRQC